MLHLQLEIYRKFCIGVYYSFLLTGIYILINVVKPISYHFYLILLYKETFEI